MSLDAAFGNNGVVSTPLTVTGTPGVAIQPDGKIVLAGVDASDTGDLTRLNPDGSVDSSFGLHGVARVATGLMGGNIFSEFVLVQPDGKIVVALTSGISSTTASVGGTLFRFNADGTPDTSFGNQGQVAAVSGRILSLTLQPDGAIVVGGTELLSPRSTQVVIARFKPGGSIDSAFGQNGVTAIPSASGINRVLITPDDKILVGGLITTGYGYNTSFTNFVYRFNADGTADTSFDGSGIATINSTYMQIEDMAVLPDGGLLILKFNASVVALTRCNYDGSLDTSFGTGGTVSDVGGSTFMIGAYRLAVRATGEIVVEGNGTDSVYSGHFTPDGKLLQSETTLTRNGPDALMRHALPVPTPTPMPDAYLFGGAIDADGKLVIAGTGYAVRLNSDGYVWSGDPNFHWAPYPSPATLTPPPVVLSPIAPPLVVAPAPVDQPIAAPQPAPLTPTAQVATDHSVIQSARAGLKAKLASLKGQLGADIAAFWKARRLSHQSALPGKTAQAAVTASLSAGAIRHAIKQDRRAIHAARHGGLVAIVAAKRKLRADVKIMHHSSHGDGKPAA